jgi:hypothetical protein
VVTTWNSFDHLHRRILSGGQRIHDLVPHPCLPPADEAIVASRMDVEASRAIRQAEVGASKTMLERT